MYTDVTEVVGDFAVGEILSPPYVSGITNYSVVMVSVLVSGIAFCEESADVLFSTVISEFVSSAIISDQFRTITIHSRACA